MNIISKIMTKNPCYTKNRKITVKGLMLHSVGCPQPNAMAFINSWNTPEFGNACVHGFIDGNTGDIYQTLPWNHRGWHGGSGPRGSCNDTHIGVEMCEPACIKYKGGSTFTCSDLTTARASVRRTYNSAVELFAYLCKQYGLNPLTDIISHKEGHAKGIATDHGDPEHLWNGLGMGYTMDTFRKAVKIAMDGGVSEAPVFTAPEAITCLGRGDSGSEVKTLQTNLITLGYSCGASGADGDFGKDTEAAVNAFQDANGLVVDGLAGEKTQAKITELMAKKDDTPKTESSAIKYYVQAGAYKSKENAQAQVNKLNKAGFDAIIKISGGMQCVQAGAFKNKDKAQELVDKLKKAGFEAIIKDA